MLNTPQLIVSGDDYRAADNRALRWTSAFWPFNLAGASLKLVIGHQDYNLFGNLPLTFTGVSSFRTASGAVTGVVPPTFPVTAALDLTAAQTTQLPEGDYRYSLVATLANGDVVTLDEGPLSVSASPGNPPLYPPAA